MMKTTKTMMAVAVLALAIGNVQAGTLNGPVVYNSLAAFTKAKSANPAAYPGIVAQGGPSFEQAKAAVIHFIQQTFKDPDAVKQLSVALPVFNTRAITHKDWIIGFVCNGKNSFGAYTGLQRFNICWRDGGIDWPAQRNLAAWDDFRAELARQVAY